MSTHDSCPNEPSSVAESACPRRRSGARRWLLATVGVLSSALGLLGVFVPGLPTTVFVIIASYCFTRSCPWLEDRLLRNRLFARSMRYVDGDLQLTPQHRLAISLVIVFFAGTSCVLLTLSAAVSPLVVASVALLALIGVAAVWLWRREVSQTARGGAENVPIAR